MDTTIERDGEGHACAVLANLSGMTYRSGVATSRPLIRVSEDVERLTGRTAEQLLSGCRSWADIIHPDDAAAVEREIAAALDQGRGFSMVHRIVHSSGEVLWVLDRAELVYDESGCAIALEGSVSDVSPLQSNEELRRSEAALREHDARLRLAQAAGGVGLYDLDLATSEARCSDYFFYVIGHTPPPNGILTLAEWHAWVHPEDRARIFAETRAALEGSDERVTAEYRVMGEDKAVWWVFSRGEIHRDASGKAIRMLGAIQDITIRKQAEERLALALRAGHAGLWDWDIKGGLPPFISPECRALYGIPEHESLTFESITSRVHAEDRKRIEDYHREVFDHGTEYTIEFRVEHPTCGLRWLRAVGQLRRDADGRPERFSGVKLDITPLKEAQQALRESEERFRKVFDSMFTFIGVLAPDGTVIETNRAPLARSELPREAVIGEKFWDTPWWNYDPAVQTRLQAAFERAVRGEVVRYDETVRIAKEGRMDIDFMLQPVFDGDNLQFLIPSGVDITVRKHAEQAIKDSDRRKDEFLATLAHELRNPLAPLRTGLEVMKLCTNQGTCERAREMMERQLRHMVRLIDDLLDISRIGRGKIELKREGVAVRSVVEHAVETSRPLIEAGGHQLTVNTPDTPIWIDGDLTRLAQVVGNLLNNSAKYTPQGGRIELTVSIEGDQAVIRVADNGIGISPESLPRVFDLFAQSSEDGRTQGGLGIGLSLVRSLVEMHGGCVAVHSPGIGQGSTFTVRLPLAAPGRADVHTREPDAEPEPERAAAVRRRVLIVDDNKDAAEMLATVLEVHGYETRTAHDGPSALAAANAFQPDVVFLDIGLPGMSGHEVAEQFRADPALAKATLVALTGWGGREDKQRAEETGFDFHLTKPVDLATIEDVLAHAGRPAG